MQSLSGANGLARRVTSFLDLTTRASPLVNSTPGEVNSFQRLTAQVAMDLIAIAIAIAIAATPTIAAVAIIPTTIAVIPAAAPTAATAAAPCAAPTAAAMAATAPTPSATSATSVTAATTVDKRDDAILGRANSVLQVRRASRLSWPQQQ